MTWPAPRHWALCAGLIAILVGGSAGAQPSSAAKPPSGPVALAPDIVADAAKPAPFPSLTSIPDAPKNPRTPEQWRALVIQTRLAGARLTRRATQEPWTLNNTDQWASQARAEAEPPPSAEPASEGDTEAFIKALRARATPPPRSH